MIIKTIRPLSIGNPGGTGPGGDGGGGSFGAANETPATRVATSDNAPTDVTVKIVFGTNFIGRKSK